jgi:hypothetical protein
MHLTSEQLQRANDADCYLLLHDNPDGTHGLHSKGRTLQHAVMIAEAMIKFPLFKEIVLEACAQAGVNQKI